MVELVYVRQALIIHPPMHLSVGPVVVECLPIVVKQVKVVQVLLGKEMQVVME